MFLLKWKLQGSRSFFSPVELSPLDTAMGIAGGKGPYDSGTGIEQYSQLIGKSLTSRADNPADDKEKERTRKRAKRANEIFRIVSKNAGLQPFFFDKFLVWSDYVEGKLNEEEFMDRVREEVKKKAESLEN